MAPPRTEWSRSGQFVIVDYVARDRKTRRILAVSRVTGCATCLMSEHAVEGEKWLLDCCQSKQWKQVLAVDNGGDGSGDDGVLVTFTYFLYLSERSGYTHLYLCGWREVNSTFDGGCDGGTHSIETLPSVQLTAGEWVVQRIVRVDEGRVTQPGASDSEGEESEESEWGEEETEGSEDDEGEDEEEDGEASEGGDGRTQLLSSKSLRKIR